MSTITLPNIRVGSDLQVRARLKDGGVAIDWSTLQNIKACIYSDAQRALAGRCAFSIDEEDSTLLVCTYAANKPQYLGVNRIVISAKYMGETKTYDKPAFSFVRWTADQEGEEITIDDPDVDVEIDVEDISSSILQEAVDAAFTAADRANDAAAAAEHMVDIHTGPEGKSAYEVAVEEGYTGTEEEWLASLVGPQGAQGIQGETGEAAGFGTVSVSLQEDGGQPSATVAASGTDTAKNFAFTFNNLKGEKGDKGDQGNSGSSVDYPYELVNNCTTNDATKGLAASQGVALASEVSQLEAKVDDLDEAVNGGTETQAVTKADTREDYRMPRNGNSWTNSSATGYNIDSFAVTPGKSYHLLVPKTGSQYTAVYEFGTTTALSNVTSGTLPDPVEHGEYTNAEYDIVIPSGMTALYVCYHEESGSPTLTTQVQAEGLVDKVGDLEYSVESVVGTVETLSGDVAQLESDMNGSEGTIIVGYDDTHEGLRMTSQAKITTSSASESAVASYPVTPGETYRVQIPKVRSQYTAAYGFYTKRVTDTADMITLPTPAVVGPATNADYSVTIPSGYSYLIVCYEFADGTPTVTCQGHIPGVKEEVASIKEEIGNLKYREIDINVPDVIYAVVGDKLQIYYESIFKVVSPFDYDIKVSCEIGSQYPRYFEVTPKAANVGDYVLDFNIKNYDGTILGMKTCTLRVVNVITSPTVNVLCVGASTTNGGEWVGEMKKRLTTNAGTPTQSGGTTLFTPTGFSLPNVKFVGRKEANGAKFEATGGYNYNSYNGSTTYIAHFYFTQENLPNVSVDDVYSDGTNQFTVKEINIPYESGQYAGNVGFTCPNKPHTANLTLTKVSGNGDATLTASAFDFSGNPFLYDGVVDVEQYAEDYCDGQIDVVFAYLFSNGLITPYQTNFTTALASMRTFINNVLAAFPSCKFGILLSQNKDARGGLGVNYGASENNIWTYEYGMKVANHNLLTALQKYITDEGLTNVFIVNILNEFDYWNDYIQTTRQVNPRSPVTEIFGRNGVHPSVIGYYQIADSATRAFIANFCQS